uniref:Cytochrome c oxidase subunit 7B, mitochondrial n=1 Tax=Marmota marmota marmota TaxID=9994 RepID=A0A8C5ZD02_MARMA
MFPDPSIGKCHKFHNISLVKNQKMARQRHEKHAPDFHDNYGNAVLTSGATFYITVWTYKATQIGKEWNLSPVGRITPKEWKD